MTQSWGIRIPTACMKPTRIGGTHSAWAHRKAVAMLLAYCFVIYVVMMASNAPIPISARSAEGIANKPNVPESSIDPNHCAACHAEEVNGFARSQMARSMRIAKLEPVGIVQAQQTTITMHSDKGSSWQTIEDRGGAVTYHVDYVVGSGTHASGYITDIGSHLFQSPVAYYSTRASYGLAPGYENKPDPDFTRPITEGCVFCHSGTFSAVPGTVNQYDSVPFPQLSIGCDRCHGSPVAHLAHPAMGNIVNPKKLAPAARDSICEQCHLIGSARVLNPGRRFSDFKAGEVLENTFTIYHDKPSAGAESVFKVISHSEQLAQSKCSLGSGGKLWCGTCHDPHNEPAMPVAFYRERCLLCHAKTPFIASHPNKASDCIGCHMPKREVQDGGHGVFTDHNIQRRPSVTAPHIDGINLAGIAPWRTPPAELAARNLGIGLIETGMDRGSAKDILSGYRTLTEVQEQFPRDSEIYNSLGSALLAGGQYSEAVRAFDLAVRFDPFSSQKETSLGQSYLLLGEQTAGEQHLERAMALDRLNLSAAALLITAYDKSGHPEKSAQLSQRIADLTQRKVIQK